MKNIKNDEETYVYKNDKEYSPYSHYNLIRNNIQDSEYIVHCSAATLRSHLNVVLRHMGLDEKSYSWHSFRRGVAHQASILGIQDSDIKKHGRWLSDAYILY